MSKALSYIGAGPAGLTAAYERSSNAADIVPIIVLKKCVNRLRGLSKTIDYKGNKMDFGATSFFSSKSDG
jgi:protoporphyrinogen oxidase